MKIFKLLGFIVKSVFMGMIAALFLFTFFPHLMKPVVDKQEQPEKEIVIEPLSFASAIQKAAPSVVNIRTFIPDPDIYNKRTSARLGVGSGVIVSAQGYIMTNYHVIADAQDIVVELIDGRTAIAEIIGVDADTDLAVLKIIMANLPVISTAHKITAQMGDIAIIIGNPYGVGQAVTMGIVSATERRLLKLSEYVDFIQTDAAVNPGNSGGALVNTKGELLGISSAYFTRGTKTGISFAIPTSLAMNVFDEILSTGHVTRGWLGFSGGPMDKVGRDLFGETSYLVTDITKGSPAEKAGLKPKDVILRVNGQKVLTYIDLLNLITETAPDSEITLEVNRDKEIITLTAIVKAKVRIVKL
ncbi:MAG: PDZ domain-containing protein [Gammaproteobacteria bacterium]|nr:PDZ domain-containing protein [Gammaproteobacteria bacterium]